METWLQELTQHPWQLWLIAAVAAALLELLVPSFSFIFLAFGAAIGAALSFFTDWPGQLLGFLLAAGGSIAFLRTRLTRIAASTNLSKHKFLSRAETVHQEIGTVTEFIPGTADHGRVEVSGADWAARATTPIAVGVRVKVHGHDGIVLLVKET
jgi:membrane protein implicated in regulation of membrane protease activity